MFADSTFCALLSGCNNIAVDQGVAGQTLGSSDSRESETYKRET